MRAIPLLFVVLAACAAQSSDGENGDVTDDAVTTASTVPPSAAEASSCQAGAVVKNALGDSVYRCTQPFADAPHLHLPADEKSGSTLTFYGATTIANGHLLLWSRDGKQMVPVDAHGAPADYAKGKGIPKTLHAPTNRATFTVYQFVATVGAATTSDYGPATAVQLVSARPVVEIDGCAFDSRLLGTWQATVSERLETPISHGGPFVTAFDAAKRLPLHITFDSIAAQPNLGDYVGGNRIADASSYVVNGVIDNFDKDVTVDGKTYPSLTAMAAKNPFFGASDGKVQLYRLGNMHGTPGDAHWVLTYPSGSKDLTLNGMSYSLTAFTGPWFLFDKGITASAASGEDPIGVAEIKPHIPYTTNGHVVELSPLSIGAHMGQCPAH